MLTTEQLKVILADQRESILSKDFGVERKTLRDIKIKHPHIIVLTGLRRSGKSTLLRQTIKKYYNDTDFYYINFEDERLFNFKAENFNNIYEVLIELYGKQKTFFIDEIQNVSNWELFVRRFYDEGFKFYITGSSAKLLSRELGTKLTGRYLNTVVKPFSFKEFLNFKKININYPYKTSDRALLKREFAEYIVEGGMPEYTKIKDKEILTRTYEDIITKDIIVRYDLKNNILLKELYQYLVSNLANKFSYNNLAKLLDFKSTNTVKKFISHLEETHFLRIINKFDNSPRKILVSEKKPFIVDNGFVSVISTKITKDKGWLLENLFFNTIEEENIYYYQGRYECDFVVFKNKKIIKAVQVCWEINEKNRQRELNGLLEAMEKFNLKEGFIITSDQEEEIRINNRKIFVKPLWKELLK